METQKPKMKTSTVIIGLAAVGVIILVFALMFAGGDGPDAVDTPSDPNVPAVQSVPTAPSDHGHAH